MGDLALDGHERIVRNGEQVKEHIQKTFGQYIGWLRDRESQLLKEVDKIVQNQLRGTQASINDTLSTLTSLKESVYLLDSSVSCKEINEQIERLLQDVTSAVQKDTKTSVVVKFSANGKNALKTAIDSCGEVFTETTQVPVSGNVVCTSTSKWTKWLQSSNFEQLEEPDMMSDFGYFNNIQKLLKTEKPSMEKRATSNACCASTSLKADHTELPIANQKENEKLLETESSFPHFSRTMDLPLENWLSSSGKRSEAVRSRCSMAKIAACAHAESEIENLDKVKCSPVANELKNWLMQPDVVQLPPVADICLGSQACQKLADCTSPSHCIGYFLDLSKRSEDWLASKKSLELDGDKLDFSSRHSSPASLRSNKSEDFEVLSNSSTILTREFFSGTISCVSDDLKLWLMSSCEPPADESEWLTLNDELLEKPRKFHGTTRIEEWLLKSN